MKGSPEVPEMNWAGSGEVFCLPTSVQFLGEKRSNARPSLKS